MTRTLIRQYAEAVVRFRWAVLVLTLLITAGLGAGVSRLRLDNDPELWSPQNHEFIKTTRKLERIFGGRNFVVVGVFPKRGDIYSPSVLRKIRNIQNAITALPEAVKHNVISLAARRVRDVQGTPDGMVVREFMERIPETQAEQDEMRHAVARNPIYVNALVSPDNTAAAVIADFRLTGDSATYAPLYERLHAIAEAERDADTEIFVGGQPAEAANFEYAMRKMPMFFGIAFVIIMLVQLLAFRSVQGMLLPMATAILSVVWGLGVLALSGIHMDALNTTTPILIMAVATGHAVQILKRYYEELERMLTEGGGRVGDLAAINRRAVSESLAAVGPVMLTAGLIASTAFFSLSVSDVSMLRHFGFFAGVGVLSALAIEFSFIPALRSILPARPRKRHQPDFVDALLERVAQLLASRAASRAVVVIAVALVSIVGVGAARVRIDNSFKQYTGSDHPLRKEGARLNSKFGGTDSLFFLVEGAGTDSMKDPKVLAGMAKLQSFLERQQHVGKTQSLADLIRRMNQAMHGDDKAYDVVPEDPNLVSQYLLLYSMSGQPEDLDNLVDNDYRNAVIWTYLKTDSTAYAASLWRECEALIRREFPQNVTVRIGGGLPQTVAVNESLVDTKVRSIPQMALVVFLLSGLALGSLSGSLLVVAPLVGIVLVNFGLMGWLGASLDMGSASITAMVVGIGADYEIYMLYRLREELRRDGDLNRALRVSLLTSGRAVLFVALSIAGGYAALLFSDFRFYPRLAITMMGTMVTSALLSLLLLRAIISVWKPKFLMRGGPVAVAGSAPAALLELGAGK